MDQAKNIVIVGGGIIGATTAYYLTRHPKFDTSLHTITLLEASSIAAGASGKAGGLLALWAYPECLVPLSYRLHQELAEQHGGAEKWGYRRVGCGSIGAVVTNGDLQSRDAAKDAVHAKAPAPQPGMSALQTGQNGKAVSPPSSNSASEITLPPEETSKPAVPRLDEMNGYANGAPVAPSLTTTAAAPTAPFPKATEEAATEQDLVAESAMEGKSGDEEITTVDDSTKAEEGTTAKSGREDKEWEKLPKQDAAAAALLKDSPLPSDLDWIDHNLVYHYEEMGRRGFTETSQVHPFHFTTAIAELARSAGVDIRLGTKVTAIHNNKDDDVSAASNKTVEYEDRRHVDAARSLTGVTDVIVAAGPWTGKLLPRSKVEGLRAHSVVYEADVSPYAVFTDIQLPKDYVPEHRRKLGQGRKHRGNVDPEIYARPFGEVYACGEPDKSVPLPETADQVQTDEAQCDDLAAYIATLSPTLAASPIRAKQACYLPQHIRFGTERGPLIGPTSTPGVWVAAGHTCWGVQNGPATGYLMAEWVFDGEARAADVDVLHPTKFKV